MAGPNSSFLDPLISPTYQDDGDAKIRRANINLVGFLVEEDPNNDALKITNTGGGGGGTVIALTDHAAFRALSSTPADGTVIHFQSPPGTYIYDASTGAGFADDDNIILKRGSTGSAGMAVNASSAVLPTYASYRLIGTLGFFTSYTILARSSKNDGGGGTFAYDSSDTTTSDNDGTILVSGAKRSKRVYAGPAYAVWWGVLGDGKFITDGVTTASSAVLSSATAGFGAGDSTKKILVRTANAVASGTVTSSGATLNGTGTNVAVDMPIIVDTGGGIGQPLSGGCIYCDGQWLVASFILTATQQMQLRRSPSPPITAKPYYTETQLPATITFSSSTTVTMSAAATISQTGVHAFYATDSTTALVNAINSCLALGVVELILPDGAIGVSANTEWVDKSHITIRGSSMSKCWLQDLRRASVYYTSGANGVLTFRGSAPGVASDVHFRDFSYDGSVPVLGMIHSSIPGVGNASGRRIGFSMQHMTNSSYQVGGGTTVGTGFYGARDEHAYIDGQSDNFSDTSVIRGCNNVSFNCNGGFNGGGHAQPENLYVGGAYTGILISAGSCIVDNVDISPDGVDSEGGMTFDLIGHTLVNGGSIHDFAMEEGVGMIDCFGNHVTDSSLTIRGTTFARNTSVAFHSGGGASMVHLNNFGGVVDISGLTETACSSTTPGGRHIVIEGSGTGRVNIRPCTFDGGSNISIGIKVVAGVPDGAVAIEEGHRFGSSVTTPFDLGAGLAALRESVTL